MQTHLIGRAGSRVLVAAAVVVLVLIASACGGGRKSTSTTTGSEATVQWAGGVCSAFTTWTKTLKNIQTSLQGGGINSLSSNELKQAANQVDDATKTLVQSIKDLGVPQTANSETAKSTVTSLQKTLSDGMSSVEDTLKSSQSSVAGAATALATVATELTTMANALTTSVNHLKQIDPGSDVEQAFKQAPSCSTYVSSRS
jgi:hypothetical protein